MKKISYLAFILLFIISTSISANRNDIDDFRSSFSDYKNIETLVQAFYIAANAIPANGISTPICAIVIVITPL